ncbi:MAG: TetR/AcrR family transcriptional regulator [Pseudomonadales bacterium]|nr:TetR/AcrR family transcriptional regulator [Pseudomonadales bacterium]
MRYPPGYKEKKHTELLKISGSLMKKNGFAATGVDTLMHAAGMTSGAFYSHFASKTDLLKTLVTSELTASQTLWTSNPHDTAEDWLDFELERYLSIQHVLQPEAGCLLPSLSAEIARADLSVRERYEQELLKGHAILTQRLGDENLAWAFICQLAGSILIARTLPTEELQRMVIHASKLLLRNALAS